MARPRHRSKNTSTKRASIGEREIAHKLDLARRRRAARQADERAARRQKIPQGLERPVQSEALRRELKRRGFRTTSRGVVVDGPRDRKGKPIPGARVEVTKSGIIKTSVGQRRDYIYGLTRAEKKKFAVDPASTERDVMARLRKMFPQTFTKGRRPVVRLQWGMYSATKQFAPTYFNAKYFTQRHVIPVAGKPRARGAKKIDTLTGFHVVIHIPKKGQHGKGRKRK